MDESLEEWSEKMDWGNEEEQVEKATDVEVDSASDNIRVAVRVRPANQREKAGCGGRLCVAVPGTLVEEGLVTVTADDLYREDSKDFTFDYAFSPENTPLDVFNAIGIDIVQCAFHGFNASLFAYGQTSSGKSYSMMGVYGTPQVGLIPRIARLLFQSIKAKSSERSSVVEASYMEIYNEKLRDLINEKKSGEVLRVRENIQLGVHVVGLTREPVTSAEDVLGVIEYGTSRRTTAATLYNSESSRSHAVFELKVQSKYIDSVTKKEMHSSSKIALIDLAGSERSEKVHSKGITLVEGNNINKSLTVLGRCIRALYDQSKGKKVIVPFRDSLLTWYLRDTLSGNSRTTMLATCSPVESNIEETLSTLRYASSAKFIKTTAKKNEDPAQAKIRELSIEVDMLKKKLKAAEEARTLDGIFEGTFNDGGGDDDEDSVGSTISSLSTNKGSGSGRGNGSMIVSTGRGSGRGAATAGKGGRTGKGKLVSRRKSNESTMSISERENLLNELTHQMGNMSQLKSSGGVSKGSEITVHGKRTTRTTRTVRRRVITTFPVLSCVSKDELLNHTLKVRIGTTLPFTVGRKISSLHEKDLKKNNFELNGMGIKTRHCEFVQAPKSEFNLDKNLNKLSIKAKSDKLGAASNSKSSTASTARALATSATAVGEEPSVAIHTLTADALVYVNGIPIKEGNVIKLNHLDRVVFGPCRFVALYLTKPLTPEERELWQYEFCVEEISKQGESESENECEEIDSKGANIGKSSNQISPARRLVLEQLRGIKAEQLAQANLIAHEMGSPFRFSCEMVIRGHLGMGKKSNLTVDKFLELNKPRFYVSCVVENYQSVKKTAEVKRTEDFLIAINKASPSSSVSSDDMLFDPSINDIANSIVSKQTLSGKADSDKYASTNENLKILFELPLYEFEDLLAELKYIHSFYSKLSNGLHELNTTATLTSTSSQTSVSSDATTTAAAMTEGRQLEMIRNLFNSHDVNKIGKISMCDVEETILMFDRYPWFDHDKDPKLFIKYVCAHQKLSQDADNIDFEKFVILLNLFLQFQFNNTLKPYVTDKYTFVKFGGVIQDRSNDDSFNIYEMEQLKLKYEREIAALKEEHTSTLNKVRELRNSIEKVHDKKISLNHSKGLDVF